jgi:hypothetical protein
MNQALASKVTMNIAGGNVPRRSRLYRAALIRAALRALDSLAQLVQEARISCVIWSARGPQVPLIASLKSGLWLLIARTAVTIAKARARTDIAC